MKILRYISAKLYSIVSDATLERLYALRNPAKTIGFSARTPFTIVIGGVLVVWLAAFLGVMAWQREAPENFIQGRPSLVLPPENLVHWLGSVYLPKRCRSGIDCLKYAKDNGMLTPTSLQDFAVPIPPDDTSAEYLSLLRLELPEQAFDSFADKSGWMGISLPSFVFNRADVYVNGTHFMTALRSADLYACFNQTGFPVPVTVEILFELDATEKSFFETGAAMPLLIARYGEFRAYQRFLVLDRAGRGDWIAEFAVITMGFFVAVLFLFIDSSVESMALAFFMGFEALSRTFDYGWLPFRYSHFFSYFTYHMAELYRLYFVLQLARFIKPMVVPWFAVSALLSVLYACASTLAPGSWGLSDYLANYEVVLESGGSAFGLLICLRVAFYLSRRGAPWRFWSLNIAALSCLASLMVGSEPLLISLGVADQSLWNTVANLSKPLSVYLLSISAFISISSLENRVRQLSHAEAKSQILERELELARTVQKQSLSIPELPDSFGLISFHEPQLSVSGDSYFVNWNKPSHLLSVLVTDVTGHGIQAALKAAAGNVVARSVWTEDAPAFGSMKERMAMFEQRLTANFGSVNGVPDIPAIVGIEIDERSGRAELYRHNSTFPLLIEPVEGNGEQKNLWRVRLLAANNREVQRFTMTPQSLIVLCSDGIVGASRAVRDLMDHLGLCLKAPTQEISPAVLEQFIVQSPVLTQRQHDDDRTMIILQWTPKAETKVEPLNYQANVV